ncbi:MAG: hypothetical protein O3C27_15235 [Actinomycetota bacterium]|nr:hypothetical protein [Actinomycetota bacterium]
MLAFFTAKGGSGCSVVASAAALLSARLGPTLLVELGGDLPAVLGLAERADHAASHRGPSDDRSDGLGLVDWLAAESPLPDSLRRIERSVSDTLSLLPLGIGPLGMGPLGIGPPGIGPPGIGVFDPRPDQVQLLIRLLRTDGRRVVLDVGHVPSQPAGRARGAPQSSGRVSLLEASDRTVLVTRACYLALRAAHRLTAPDQVVLISEPGRALSAADVAAAVGSPVAAVLRWDPAIARSVDAGVLRDHLPRSLRCLADLVAR